MPPDGGTAKGKNRQNKIKRMKILNALKGMVPYRLVLMRRELLPLWALWTRKNMKRKDMIEILHFHLVDHCNLNCRGCDNFSPLAPETYTELCVRSWLSPNGPTHGDKEPHQGNTTAWWRTLAASSSGNVHGCGTPVFPPHTRQFGEQRFVAAQTRG